MSFSDRQNRLVVVEDWKKIYQSFRNAEFKSYDFDSLRRIMISYLKENYPEDFNDYIETSEYIALIDLIAFIAQNLAFRIDLNARENFLDLAERRESILRLARLLSYNIKRNQCANGLLKIVGVSTTEKLISSNNINLQNQTIIWNDPANLNWYEQFNRILNAALPDGNTIGKPLKSQNINGIQTKQYRFNSISKNLPVFPFTKNIKGSSTNFETVSCDLENNDIVEEPPLPGNQFAFLYREDGQGPDGTNTGFFCHFKQGTLSSGPFSINNPSPNQVVAIETKNINNTDVWLYSLDSNNKENELWEKVSSVEGNNIVYNDIIRKSQKIYSVLSRIDDKISLIFSDGLFGEIPQGNFKLYYRSSKNQNISISPQSMRGITVNIPYMSRAGVSEKITLTLSLKYPVNNSSKSETNESIKRNAPATYYTQNRLITAEDYQIGADSISQDIIKSKTINRTSSGISRYLDLIDPTGKYSNTTLFSEDGILYKNYIDIINYFSFSTRTDAEGLVYNIIEPIFTSHELVNYYMDSFPRLQVRDFNIVWDKISYQSNHGTGMFLGSNFEPIRLGVYSESVLKYLRFNVMVKFVAPEGYVFKNGETVKADQHDNGLDYIWCKIINIIGNGTEKINNHGPVSLNMDIPDRAILSEIITPLPTRLSEEVRFHIIDFITSYRTFGLRYSQTDNEWKIINQNNLNLIDNFSTIYSGDSNNQQLDSSWLILFKTDGNRYTMTHRALEYIFESDRQLQFYFDTSENTKNNTTKKDLITVLSINNDPDSQKPLGNDHIWTISDEYKDLSGYATGKKVKLSLTDSDDDGVVDDPDIFDQIVNETNDRHNKIVFMKAVNIHGKTNDYEYVNKNDIDIIILDNKRLLYHPENYTDGQLFYFIDENSVEKFKSKTLTTEPDPSYKAYFGRDNLKFSYVHNSDINSRIDPSVSNIMDTYILSNNYDIQFRKWLKNVIPEKPLPPSSDALHTAFNKSISKIKSISDEIIYHPVKYRILFGPKAHISSQAIFKVVKNPTFIINDNELKSEVISCINKFFELENWDFGETFYFSELSAYVMNTLSPKIYSILIVPVQHDLSYGSLHEIHCKSDEIFISDASVDNIDIIDEITAKIIKSDGKISSIPAMRNDQVLSSK